MQLNGFLNVPRDCHRWYASARWPREHTTLTCVFSSHCSIRLTMHLGSCIEGKRCSARKFQWRFPLLNKRLCAMMYSMNARTLLGHNQKEPWRAHKWWYGRFAHMLMERVSFSSMQLLYLPKTVFMVTENVNILFAYASAHLYLQLGFVAFLRKWREAPSSSISVSCYGSRFTTEWA